jgi:hypothetical protein
MMRDLQCIFRASDVAREFAGEAERVGLPLCKFAARVVDAYHARVPQHDRETKFHVATTNGTDEIFKVEKANAQIIQRFKDGTVKFPLDLIEAWCDALPAPLDLECRRALARRMNLLGATIPTEGDSATNGVADMAIEFGQTMQALAPLMADGRIDANDDPRMVSKALRECNDLMAALVSLQAVLMKAQEGRAQQEESSIVPLRRQA